MKQTITESMFKDAFARYGRGDQFSWGALGAIFEHLEECEDGGEELELDPIAVCCDFTEYASATEAVEDYSFEPDADEDEDDQEESALEWLRDHTTVLEFDGGIVIQAF